MKSGTGLNPRTPGDGNLIDANVREAEAANKDIVIRSMEDYQIEVHSLGLLRIREIFAGLRG